MTSPAADGLVVVDKPVGPTSHDVVARLRRLAGTRRVGHAGTLDPMASGVLVIGIGKATRLLGHLALRDKSYTATARLGADTSTDDADGDVIATAPVDGLDDPAIRAAFARFVGDIEQVPPQVSAIKVDGKRSYARARAGETVTLAARRVTIGGIDLGGIRRTADGIDVDFSVTCSSGTYVRAIARDAGAALGCGGHLTALRRTRVGPYLLETAHTLDDLAERFAVLPLADAVAAAFPRREVSEDQAAAVSHGGRLPAMGLGDGPIGVFAPDGSVLALVEERAGAARPLCVFVP